MKKHKITQNLIVLTLVSVIILLWGAMIVSADPVEDVTSESDTSVTEITETATEPTTLLPEVQDSDIEYPAVVGRVDEQDDPSLGGGFVMWTIVGVLVAVVLAIVLTSKTKAYRGGGKKRYSTGNKMGSGPHLLNDKYYHKRKQK